MEQRSRAFYASISVLKLVLLRIFCFQICCVQCQEKSIGVNSSAELSSPSTSQNLKTRFLRFSLSILFGITTGLVCSLLSALLLRWFLRYINRTPILKGSVVFSPKVPAKALQLALANETHLLGSSPNGKYYKTVLDSGLVIAVKRLEPFEPGSPEVQCKSVKRMIQQELKTLASLRHRNLMSLRAYAWESHRFSLVYDYVPTGSLEDAMARLRENQLKLSWEVRLKIAVGIVKGLQYLHFTCNPRILHYNLKPTNVMLDIEFEPRLADYGLAKIVSNFNREASGYNAPASFQNCRYTDKSDVYSFGAILGVLLTGKCPTDTFFSEASSGGSLGQWLRHLQQAGEAREILDRSIIGEEVEEDEMLMAVKIAVVCLSDLPADRPSSDELVSMLTQLNSF